MTDTTFNLGGVRKRKFIDRTEEVVQQWDPTENMASGYEDFYKSDGSIVLRIDRFSEFARGNGLTQWSALKYIRGLPWQISPSSVEITENEQWNDLPLFLHCKYKSGSTAWSCNTTKRIYRVLSQKEGVDDFVKSSDAPHIYNGNYPVWGWHSLLTNNELLDPEKGYIKDDTVILQMDMIADAPRGIQEDEEAHKKAYNDVFGSIGKNHLFSSTTDYQWDFVLVVQEKRVHVAKSILSLHSEYFKQKFAEDGDNESAILHNIDYEEFVELLSVIYLTSYLVTVENVETVAKLAYIFKMNDVLRQCEVVLMMNSCKFGRIRTFLLSHWYGMEHLQAKCVAELKAISELKQLKEELEFAALDCRAKAILLDQIVGSCPKKSLADISTSKTVEAPDHESASSSRASEISARLASSVMAQSDATGGVFQILQRIVSGRIQRKNQDEIELEEVEYSDILELLAVIYPCGYPVTDENLEVILKLADRFIMPEILERCKKVLESSEKLKRALKLYLAQRYHFPDLQIEYAKEYKSVEDVKTLQICFNKF